MMTNSIDNTRSNMELLPVFKRDMFRPRIKHFLDKLTAEQWQLLLFNSPDEPLTFLTAELLTNLWTLISNTIMSALQNTCEQLSKEKVSASLGDALPQGFADALGVEEEVRSESAEKLKDILATEVTDTVNSSIFTRKHKRCIPSTCRLNAMLGHFFSMLKNMMAKVKKSCTKASCRRRKDNQPSSYQSHHSYDSESKTKIAEDIIKEKMNSFMDQVEQEDGNARPSEEIEKVAGEVAKDLTLYKTPRRKSGVAHIKLFTTKNLAKASLGRTLKWLVLINGVECSPRESNKWMERMYDRIESLIGSQLSEATCKEFTDDAYHYICSVEERSEDDVPEESEGENMSVASSRADTYNEIWRSIMAFLAVLKWWEKTQADSHARKLVQEVESTLSSQTSSWEDILGPGPARPEPVQERDMRRMAVRVFVQKLVCRTFSEAEVNTAVDNFQPIIERLSEQIWYAVKDVKFVVTQKNFKDLDKKVYKDLCDRWGCAEVMLVHMNIKDSQIENLLASSFEEHLISPQKKRGFCSIFCGRG